VFALLKKLDLKIINIKFIKFYKKIRLSIFLNQNSLNDNLKKKK